MDDAMLAAGLIALTVAGLMYAFAYPYLSGDARAEKRALAIAGTKRDGAALRAAGDPAKRRKQIADTLKEMESVKKKKRVTVEQRLAQAGLKWSKAQYFMLSGALGLGGFFLLLVVQGSLWASIGGAFVGALGAPTWFLGFLSKRRTKKFIEEFPGAIDVVVRGIRAGLPVADCFRVVASEAPEPVRGEFRQVVEAQSMGLGVGEAVERLADRIPVPEVSFFTIVVTITSKTGGNLSDTLNNLSTVLRDRKKMRGKIQAMSTEAKTSAAIIGALPFLVCGAIYFIQPSYILVLFTTFAGKIIVACGLGWMLMGILVMRKMINFDF
ncbi:MAG TPA: type II secretion system F family protein [Methylocystis sp.]|nr:type II secretion system F family protein [Methylocystis sp.]